MELKPIRKHWSKVHGKCCSDLSAYKDNLKKHIFNREKQINYQILWILFQKKFYIYPKEYRKIYFEILLHNDQSLVLYYAHTMHSNIQ